MEDKVKANREFKESDDDYFGKSYEEEEKYLAIAVEDEEELKKYYPATTRYEYFGTRRGRLYQSLNEMYSRYEAETKSWINERDKSYDKTLDLTRMTSYDWIRKSKGVYKNRDEWLAEIKSFYITFGSKTCFGILGDFQNV